MVLEVLPVKLLIQDFLEIVPICALLRLEREPASVLKKLLSSSLNLQPMLANVTLEPSSPIVNKPADWISVFKLDKIEFEVLMSYIRFNP
jgi:hypothetical protein